MNQAESITQVLQLISIITLGGLVLFQLLHFIIGSWRFWAGTSKRLLFTSMVGLFWIMYGCFFVYKVTSINSYVNAIPYVLLGLYTPTILTLLLLAFSKKVRTLIDQISLKWAIQSVEGPARMIVGVLFLFWYFAGQLPGVVAWVAGPGDWIAGFISFYAVRRLHIFTNLSKIDNSHWSVSDFLNSQPKIVSKEEWYRLRKHLWIAMGLVAFGIIDFILAPASTAISIGMGVVPEAMGSIPLTLIPLVLVPQVLLLEVFAMRQLFQLNKFLKEQKVTFLGAK